MTVLLTTVSCGSSDPITDPPSTDPTIVDTTEGLGPDSERQRIFDESSAAYVEFWNIWLEANNPPDPGNSRLSDRYTGRQLAGAKAGIQEHLDRGLIVRDAPDTLADHQLEFLDVEADRVIFSDCTVDDGQLVEASTGAIVDGSVLTILRRVSMVKEGGAWKVESADKTKTWVGATTCES
ncbi:MAG: hypothetical protein ACXWCM_01180 [Acidimicrobiales bacterium]